MKNRKLLVRLSKFISAIPDPSKWITLEEYIKAGGKIENLRPAKVIRLEDM